ncbi:uncharacterized protein LOC9655386 isoform X1 [Selaginella moellendorffii]|uniref:uncharacterized protein LOC9655386 isoform X1 n=1 Tax=Selaginella moellendorffii TaxID=88036 RepID=UPI000D1C3470|nr:uncharacterized protein LOC9655386 isoform X1 [Selaginella moellendorffii]|eukprot:XP_024526434.1 uncharacterized protein LOC9655386 isoform X1 [Selaginella moellendorffii]
MVVLRSSPRTLQPRHRHLPQHPRHTRSNLRDPARQNFFFLCSIDFAPKQLDSLVCVDRSIHSQELQQLQLELRLLEALEIYHPSKLQGIHRHFILYGLMEFLEKRLNRHFSAEEILQTLNGFYNLELLKPDDEEVELASHQEDFSLPSSVREDPKDG